MKAERKATEATKQDTQLLHGRNLAWLWVSVCMCEYELFLNQDFSRAVINHKLAI